MKQYNTIYADPPWSETGGGKIHRGADRHYPLMKTKEIMDMCKFIRSISNDNCHLYLWVTNNFIQDGFRVMEHWGFVYKTMITWMKDRFGLGQYFRGITEHCLFGVKGVLPYKIIENKRQQGVTGFTAPRMKHSQKPEEMRRMIEKVSYAPYIELFARQQTPGWDVWGNEVEIALPVNRPTVEGQDKGQFMGVTACPHENPSPNAEPEQGFIIPQRPRLT